MADFGKTPASKETFEGSPPDGVLLPAILQPDTVGVVHVSDLGYVQEQTENGRCALFLQYGARHVLHAYVTGG